MKHLLTLLTSLLFFSFATAQNYRWAYGFGGPNNNAQGTAIALDANANVYVTGAFGDSIDFDPGPGVSIVAPPGMFLAKYDSAGIYQGAFAIPGTGSTSMAVNATGIYITGKFGGTVDFDPGPAVHTITSNGNFDIFIVKYDLNGIYQWAIGMGGAHEDVGNSIAIDNVGNSYLTGSFKDTIDFDPGAGVHNLISHGIQDVFFAKYNNNGNYIWAHSIGDTSYNSGLRIIINKSENFIYVSGYFKGSPDFDPGAGSHIITAAGPGDDFIARYDSSGNFIWAGAISSAFTGGNLIGEITTSTTPNNSEYLYVTGLFRNVTDFDLSANVFNLSSVSTSADLFFAKYDNSGNLIWIKTIAGSNTGGVTGVNVKIGKDASLFLCGFYYGTTDFDPGAGVSNLSCNGITDIFFAKYDSVGNYIWAKGMGGSFYDKPAYLALDSSDNQYLTGYFSGTMDCDPGLGTVILNPSSNQNIFIGKYISIPTGIFNEFPNASSIVSVYPNPANNKITINGNLLNQSFRLRILDLTGRIVLEKTIANRTIDVSSLQSGVYFIEINLSNKNYRVHFIKE
jgi:hypothetical protein